MASILSFRNDEHLVIDFMATYDQVDTYQCFEN